jgi:carnitine O-acetyltransferase
VCVGGVRWTEKERKRVSVCVSINVLFMLLFFFVFFCFLMENANPFTSFQVIVVHKTQFYEIEAMAPNGSPLTAAEWLQQLNSVLSQGARQPAGHMQPAMGLLTSLPRDEWASTHSHLRELSVCNAQTINSLTRAIAVVCLDTLPAGTWNGALSRVLHGHGADPGVGESANRWFDKSVQLVATPDGYVGINLEHSAYDGGPATTFINHLIADAPGLLQQQQQQQHHHPIPRVLPAPRLLLWDADDRLKQALVDAGSAMNKLATACAVETFSFTEYDQRFIKQFKLSPDSYFQMAIQVAYYRLHGTMAATYESASTRMFQLGRTETIRSCSTAARHLAETLDAPSASPREKMEKLALAIQAHKSYSQVGKERNETTQRKEGEGSKKKEKD